jgi:hypothetical protein
MVDTEQWHAMNKYTFKWNLTPAVSVEYTIQVPPFEAVASDNGLRLAASASAADEQSLERQARLVANDLVQSLSSQR